MRTKDDNNYVFVLNYMNYPIKVNVKKPMTNLLTGETAVGEIEIEKYGVLVLK